MSAGWEFGDALSNERLPSNLAIVWKFTAHFWWILKWREKRDLKGRARAERVFLQDAELGLWRAIRLLEGRSSRH